MQIDKRNRSDLKQYFVMNAIPTESNFAELIDGMLNQKEDGIAKLPNDALSIEAAGDPTSQKKAIHFYNNFADPDPAWVLSLNPRQNPADPATARAGFSISDSAGTSRLFIDRTTGRLGVGTLSPQAALHIDRGATNDLALKLSSAGPGWGSGLQLLNTSPGAGKTFGIYAGSSGSLHFADVNTGVDRILVTGDGNIGIGVTPSGGKLHVAGIAKANRFTSDNALVLNDYQTPNPSSNVYLYSPPGDRDAWVYLDSADSGSNWGIYHRQINNPVKGLPANAIGFVGGGTSKLQAYISLADGSAFFAGPLQVTSGSRHTGDRHFFTDVEAVGRVRVGAAWGVPGLYSEDAQDIVIGCASGRTVHLGQLNQVRALNGSLTVPAGLIFEGAVAHIDRDGALYRNTDGQCYLTVDDNFYIRDISSGTAAHFDTNAGNLILRGDIVFGSTISTSGRMHITGGERCYLLHKDGVIIGKEWGGTGTLSVQGSKNFHIDHPLDSKRFLVHSVIEGPEATVFYRGEAALVNGKCEIDLPLYFEALTRKENRTVLVTPKLSEDGETSALAAGEVVSGRFVVCAIDGRNPRQRFYWEVKGVRADIDPIEVEPLKTDFAAPPPRRSSPIDPTSGMKP